MAYPKTYVGAALDEMAKSMKRLENLPDHFVGKLRVDADGCWRWVGAKREGGYGVFWDQEKQTRVMAHRFAYEKLAGPIPDGLQIDHLCRVPACVNPAHMEPVTLQENVKRGARATATHCKWGHEYTPENTILVPNGRDCRECSRTRKRLWARKEAQKRREAARA